MRLKLTLIFLVGLVSLIFVQPAKVLGQTCVAGRPGGLQISTCKTCGSGAQYCCTNQTVSTQCSVLVLDRTVHVLCLAKLVQVLIQTIVSVG